MKIAITGGAGFLAYHIARLGVSRGYTLRLLDIAPFEPADYDPSVECRNVDVRDKAALKEAFQGMDIVVHGAAALPLWKKEEIYDINVRGTRNVLEAAQECGVQRVIFISSTAVYGVPKVHPLFEDSPLIGVGPYGESKIAAEKVCEEFRTRNLCVPVIRPKTFIGSGRLGVFQILYDWVESGKRIPVIGSGHNRYQLLEVEDLAEAVFLCATSPVEKANDTFNVGAKEFNTVQEDLGALCKHANSGARVMGTPAPFVKFWLGIFESMKLSPLYKWVYGTADKDSFVSTEKIEKTLGWDPKYSNSQALIRSYQWYQEHKGEIAQGTGITHRIAWDQGVLKFFKRWM